jgi:hypothetical protein
MNTPAAIEIALATIIRDYAELGEGTVVRAWQSPNLDPLAGDEDVRRFPAVDVVANGPEYTDDLTASVTCAILCRTKFADDEDRAFLREMFSEIERVARALFAQYRGDGGEELTAWADAFAVAAAGDGINHDSVSFQWGPSQPPSIDGDGTQSHGLSLVIHYSRTDF